jgi:Mn-dependent DtxR family transcriptional regulator
MNCEHIRLMKIYNIGMLVSEIAVRMNINLLSNTKNIKYLDKLGIVLHPS